jgi:hypothetical protein
MFVELMATNGPTFSSPRHSVRSTCCFVVGAVKSEQLQTVIQHLAEQAQGQRIDDLDPGKRA